jgi:hypothetical protein
MNARKLLMIGTTFCFLGIQLPASAAVISTGDYLSAERRGASLARIESALSRADVHERLESLGVDAVAAADRAAALSDSELEQLAAHMDTLPAGGDGVLAVIGIVFLVLLILEVTGATNIFNRV